MRRGIGSTILLATAAGAAASLSPLTSADAMGWTPERSDPLSHLVRPAPARNPAWLDGKPHDFRDRLVAVGNEFRTVGTLDGTVSFLRIARDARALSGQARVIDGDTLELGGARIRLYGIDAPESAQRCRAQGRLWACGREATRTLARLVRLKQVACEERDRDRYGRIVAVCTAAGRDLNAWMVAEGWAVAYRRYSRAYVATERRARAAKRGVWQGEFVPPRRSGRKARAGATSRAISAGAASAFTTCRAGATTAARGSTRRGASGGSAPRARPAPRDGADRASSERVGKNDGAR